MSDHIPTADLLCDLLQAIARDDPDETLEAAVEVAKAALRDIKESRLEVSSPTVGLKIERTLRRLRADLRHAPPAPTKRRRPASRDDDDADADVEDPLPSIEDLD